MIRFLLLLLLSIFSVENRSFESRSIGGRPTWKGEDPWLVLITAVVVTRRSLWYDTAYIQFYCGGSVISDYWILTAAHCFKDLPELRIPRYWTVKLATNKLQDDSTVDVFGYFRHSPSQSPWQQWNIKPSRIITNPYYDSRSDANDIALMKLSSGVPAEGTNRYIRKVDLPKPYEYFPRGMMCIVSGWGCTRKGGPVSPIARTIQVPILSGSDCFRIYGERNQNKICAGYYYRNIGVCKGDSGGGLVCVKNGRYIIAGTVAYGSKQYPGQYPSVYERVSSHIYWIKKYVVP